MRRRAGVAAIQHQQKEQERFRERAQVIQENQIEELSRQLERFREKLSYFAAKHKDEIKRDCVFRKKFQDMCARIGVDPLASSKGFWAKILDVGDFYYELGVQIVEICLATQSRNGGLISLDELLKKLHDRRIGTSQSQEISQDDVVRSIRKLRVLGTGFSLISSGKTFLVQSVPRELSMDHAQVLQAAESNPEGFVSISSLVSAFEWEKPRAISALDDLLKEGMAWRDDQSSPEVTYWIPSLFPQLVETGLA
ncbi:unnamed protein product [Cyprideis torosa]|uniref:Vacuolar-sorting protein SNF8 n=1 Tax=Cyprideis torosa TaxID=163714 RepID=A0A7R8WKM4_9CRUS|nr:unnamed protein product [Cyprideis torosa]CAG0900620.1 unnamed protein product [Cyprideis torosa]